MRQIVYFDGVCGLCNSAVDRLIKWDKHQRLLFAPLQGETAQKALAGKQLELNTIIFEKGGQLFTKSEAVFELLGVIGGWRKVGMIFRIFPLFLRDVVYDYIARNRYRWFGKKEACRILTAAERKRFLP